MSCRRESTTTSRSLFLLSPLNEEASETKNDRIETGREALVPMQGEALGCLLFPIREEERHWERKWERGFSKEFSASSLDRHAMESLREYLRIKIFIYNATSSFFHQNAAGSISITHTFMYNDAKPFQP